MSSILFLLNMLFNSAFSSLLLAKLLDSYRLMQVYLFLAERGTLFHATACKNIGEEAKTDGTTDPALCLHSREMILGFYFSCSSFSELDAVLQTDPRLLNGDVAS